MMTQDDIIRMAREAGIGALTDYGKEALERFAALVAAHEREKPTTEALRQAYIAGMRAEREACALICDHKGKGKRPYEHWPGDEFAAAIRARSKHG